MGSFLISGGKIHKPPQEVVLMTEEQFRAEKLYYISLSIAKSMLEKGVIDKEVLAIIDTKLLEKYRPVSGTLLAGKPLLW